MTPDALVDAPHERLEVVPQGERAVVLRVSAAAVTDGARTWPGAADADVADVDGDGVRELVTCGPDGLSVWPWEPDAAGAELGAVVKLSAAPCRAVAASTTALWALGDDLHRWSLPGPVDRGVAGGGGERLAADARDAWVSSGTTVTGAGGATFTATAPIEALVAGPWWLADGTLAGPGGPARAFGGATGLALADLDGDGVRERIVAHRGARLVGVVGADGTEQAWPSPLDPVALAAGDLDGDGRAEVVVGDGRTFVVLRGERAPSPEPAPLPAPVPGPAPPPAPQQRLFGLRIVSFAGAPSAMASGRVPSSRTFTWGVGLAGGSLLGPGRGIGGFVAGSVAWEFGGPPLRTWFGLDTVPLLLQAGVTATWHLAMLSGGLTVGGPHLRSGPYATVGLGAGLGWRAVLTPTERPSGQMHGFEARITALQGVRVADGTARPTGEVLFLYASTIQQGRRRGRFDPLVPPAPAAAPARGRYTCRRLAFALGAAGGLSSTRYSWEFIGTGQTVELSGSPYASVSCESGEPGRSWLVGVETAPLFAHRIPWDTQAADQVLHHMGSATVGAVLGGDAARVGPIATAGIWTLGAGLRAAVTPFASARGVHHGLELRAIGLFPSAPAGEAMLAWVAWVDPRRVRVDER